MKMVQISNKWCKR